MTESKKQFSSVIFVLINNSNFDLSGRRGDAVSAFSRKSLAKSFPEIIWWCSHIVILHRGDFKQSLTAIVLPVKFKSFI